MKATMKSYGFWLGSFFLWELVLRFTAEQGFLHGWTVLGFTCAAAVVPAVLTGLPGWGGRISAWILPPLLFLIYAIQLVYYDIFGSFLSLAFVSVGGEAVTTFWKMVLTAIWRCLPRLMLMAAPLAAFYILRRRSFFRGQPWKGWLAELACAVILVILLGQNPLLHNKSVTVDRWAEHFGLFTAEALDLERQIFGSGGAAILSPDGSLDLTRGGRGERNILPELNLKVLDEKTEDESLKTLNRYFSGLRGTEKNEYTGYFQGKNLIVVCAEAFSPYLIDETLTPTLYRLSQEGFQFRNFYNSFPNLTTNGEYSLCMGLMPDLSRMSFLTSASNSVPFCLGNRWSAAGGKARAYHNNVGTFYHRDMTHTNMGYDFQAQGSGLELQEGRPTSDLEMMEKSVDDYIGQEPFHTYYMTYSGHADYGFDLNDISRQNEALVEEIEGSEALRAYYACQLELERAMAYLLDRLEKAGIADRTVIVLTGDHMPYGLTARDYAQLAGEAVSEPFWQYRNCFICWNGAMEEPVVVEDACCTQDILPTLLNLFGLPYDSRLLTGRDILADCVHAAVLKDGSFLTSEMIYDSGTESVTWLREPDEEYAQAMIRAVENQFSVSAEILKTNYYEFAFSTLGLSDGETEHTEKGGYTDIEGTWYEDAVTCLTERGALNGGGSGAFDGERPVTRAGFAAMLTRGLELPVSDEEPPYTDLKTGSWYSDAVRTVWKLGLLEEGETEFRPNEPITAEETEKILEKAAEYRGVEDAAQWAENAMETVEQKDGAPEGQISRGAAAFLVERLLRETERQQ